MYPLAAGSRFRAELRTFGGVSGFDVPADVVAQLGGHPRVVATVNGHRFRAAISRTSRGYWLGVSPWRRAAAGITGRRPYDIDVELDFTPISAAAWP